jgi:hypothetical protein
VDDIHELQIEPGGTLHQAEELISGEDYSYGKDGRLNKTGAQKWRCTVRNAVIVCSASVLQSGDIYIRRTQPHKRTANQGTLLTAKVKEHLRNQGKQCPFASGDTGPTRANP